MTTPTLGAELTIGDVGIAFGGIRALSGVTLDVAPEGLTAIIGPNGAGKTTLFNCITGLYRCDGRIALDGERIDRLPPHERASRGIARTFQTPALVEEGTVLENVLLGTHRLTRAGVLATFVGLPGVRREEREAHDDALAVLEQLDMAGMAGEPVAGLPHRARRMVEIARAMVARPRIVLLDEPAAGSHHTEAQAMLRGVQAAAAATGTTVVLVEHNVSLVMEVATRIVVLDFGEVIADGDAPTVQRDQRVIDAYLGQSV